MKIFSKKFIILFLVICFIIFGFIFFSFRKAKLVKAGAGDNVSGFVWSENIGWLSFNSTNVGGGADYGVNIDSSSGIFSGYAWSENIGWVRFNPESPFPASPNYSACLDLPGAGQVCDGIGDYNIGGWARACSVFFGWSYRKKITIDNANVFSDLSNFPLYVAIKNDSDIGANSRTDGYDIRFAQIQGNDIILLPYEREYFNISNGLATGYFWVRVPTIKNASPTEIYVYYGKPDALDGQNPVDVWIGNYQGVYHLGESSGNANDSSINNHMGVYDGDLPSQVDGKIYKAQDFDGNQDTIDLGNNTFNTDFSGADGLSFSLWANIDSIKPDEWNNMLSLIMGSSYYSALEAAIDPTNGNRLVVGGRSIDSLSTFQYVIGTETDLSNYIGSWIHLAGVLDFPSDQIYMYINGNSESGSGPGPLEFNSNTYQKGIPGPLANDQIGSFDPNSELVEREFDGKLDEVRIYKGKLSSNWIRFEFYNINNNDNELNWGNQESVGSPCSGTLSPNSQRGGWDGWLKLKGVNYGVSLTFNQVTNLYEFEGWAWGNDVIGWVSFNCYDQEGVCGNSEYKGKTNFNLSPNQPGFLSETWDYCGGGAPQVALGVKLVLNWQYTDPEGDSQASYEIWIDDDVNFPPAPGAKFNHIVNSSSQSYTVDLNDDDDPPNPGSDWLTALSWNTTYYWKVKVKDINGNWSDFSTPHSFIMPSHAYPYPDFTFESLTPGPNDVVIFSNISKCYNSGGETSCQPNPSISYEWNFNYPIGPINPMTWDKVEYIYSGEGVGTYAVRLKITDNSVGIIEPQWCSRIKYVPVGIPLFTPGWKEITP